MKPIFVIQVSLWSINLKFMRYLQQVLPTTQYMLHLEKQPTSMKRISDRSQSPLQARTFKNTTNAKPDSINHQTNMNLDRISPANITPFSNQGYAQHSSSALRVINYQSQNQPALKPVDRRVQTLMQKNNIEIVIEEEKEEDG